MEFFIGEPALKTQRPHQSLMRRLWCGKPHRQKFVLRAAARTALGAEPPAGNPTRAGRSCPNPVIALAGKRTAQLSRRSSMKSRMELMRSSHSFPAIAG